jgi:hypothetical protein
MSKSHDAWTTDVLVVGAGAAGIPAAIGAARAGARVMLIEEDPIIGGAVSDYYVDIFCGGPITGVVREAETALKDSHRLTKNGNFFLPLSFQQVYGELLEREKNVTLLTGARAVHVLVKEANGKPSVVGVQVETGTRQTLTIQSRVTIDATGTGEVSILAGCESMYGREATQDFGERHAPPVRDTRVQHCTWMYISQQLREGAPLDMMKLDHVKLGVHVDGMGWFHQNPEEAMRRNPGIFLHWGCALECPDTRNPMELGKVQREALRVMEHDLSLLQEHGYAIYLAPRIGVREAGRIVGTHVITEQDLRSGKLPEDTIAIGTYGLDLWGEDEGIDVQELRTPLYGIPYRALTPKEVDGLLLAGKIISGTHVAMSAYRVMPIVGCIGQAAGVAASLCVQHDCQPRQIDARELQTALRSQKQNVALSLEKN